MTRPFSVLFLCTGNSARSIMAECALNRRGEGRFRAFSAGSRPAGRVHPMAQRLLGELGYDTSGLRSKSWDEFATNDAPAFDCVLTVCDNAAGEVCPIWPGQPITAHWGVEDPAAFVGSEAATLAEFRRVYSYLDNRAELFAALPIATLDRLSLQRRLEEIGKSTAAETEA